MSNQLEALLKAARGQLPNEAFSVTERTPWPEGVSEVVSYELLPLNRNVYDVDRNILDEEIAEQEDLAELEIELMEGGFETLALYLSFHRPLSSGQWGIFLIGEPMWRLREKIRHDLDTSQTEANILSQELVLSHEIYHFRVDLYTLHQELLLRKPLYIPYTNNVYATVWCTSHCYEESLANRSAVDAAAGLARRRSVFVRDITRYWYAYVKDFCHSQPPGYRDWSRHRSTLRERLGGQLHPTQPLGVLAELQAHWVGLCPTSFHWECPIYLVRRTPASCKGLRLIVKIGGDVMEIHRYDPDPFPSKPHAHNKQTGEKINLSTGDIFDPRTRSYKGKYDDRRLRQLRDELSRKWPDVVLPGLSS